MSFDAPQSRNEAILQNMLGADNVLEPTQSRVEDLLKQILDSGGSGGEGNAVKYTAQSLTDPQKAQARTNIAAAAVPTVETISGTSATIDAEVNTIYKCGELSALTIDTFPPTGSFSVVFTSGSTATVFTEPSGMTMPDGFSVEANKRYEINVSDGYAVVASWAVSA